MQNLQIEGKGVEKMMEAYNLRNLEIQKIGNDINVNRIFKIKEISLKEISEERRYTYFIKYIKIVNVYRNYRGNRSDRIC